MGPAVAISARRPDGPRHGVMKMECGARTPRVSRPDLLAMPHTLSIAVVQSDPGKASTQPQSLRSGDVRENHVKTTRELREIKVHQGKLRGKTTRENKPRENELRENKLQEQIA